MSETKKEIIYGITVYDILTDNKIPYQLTFERDLFVDRINVSLVPMIDPQKKFCADLKREVIESFLDYFENNPSETVYLDIDIYHERNKLTFYKFLKWMQPYFNLFNIEIELTINDSISYVEIYIKKIN